MSEGPIIPLHLNHSEVIMIFELSNHSEKMEKGSIEKKMKTNNSRFICNALNHEIIVIL